MYFDCSIIFARLPIPKPKFTFGVSRGQELAIWAEFQTASIALIQMASKRLGFVLLKITFAIKS
jgi:hypothetical protein